MSFGHRSLCRSVTWSLGHLVTQSLDQLATRFFQHMLLTKTQHQDLQVCFADKYPKSINFYNNVCLQAIRHEKLNRAQNPCEPSSGYNLAQCVDEYVMRKVGCQPPWRRFNVTGLPLCDDWTLLHYYSSENAKLATVVRNKMMNVTNCLMPCSFMEYKVSDIKMCYLLC